MRATVFFVVIAIIACIAAVATDKLTSDGNRPGRFVVVPAQVQVSPQGTAAPELLKVDTVTGRTWFFQATVTNGRTVRQWVEVQ